MKKYILIIKKICIFFHVYNIIDSVIFELFQRRVNNIKYNILIIFIIIFDLIFFIYK